MRKRYFPKKPKNLKKNYDSMLEQRLHEGALKDTQHHVPKEDLVPYYVEHTYEPDFLFSLRNKMYILETKGRFIDSQSASKYIWIREHLEDWHVFQNSSCKEIELVILFENANTPMPFAKKRKDGTKFTHGEWATKNGFRWLCEKSGHLADVKTRTDLLKKLEEENT